MIYVQLLPRVTLETGKPLLLKLAAQCIGPEDAGRLVLPCPDERGIWKVTAMHVTRALHAAYPEEEITLVGADVCYVHRDRPRSADPTRLLRTAFVFLLLCLGGALGLAWFHADVDMPRAQAAVYEALTGEKPADPRLITIPYAVGVALGVTVFYALPSRKATTPLEIKLTEYREDMEKTEGRSFD